MPRKPDELWQCPQCGATFVTPQMWHSCGRFELEPLFKRSEPQVRRLFDRLAKLVQACGPVTVLPQKTRIVFQARVRFINCVPRKSHLLCSFGLARRLDHRRFHKIERYGPRWYGHQCRIETEADFDDDFKAWVQEAYAVGQQKHLGRG